MIKKRSRRSGYWPSLHALVPALAASLASCGGSTDDAGDVTATHTADIVGGGNAVAGAHPWIARLYITQPDTNNTCGGALIARSWILTAAHCVDGGVSAGGIFVMLGEYDTTTTDGNEQPNFVDEIHINPAFDSASVVPHNDMALLKLHTPATLNSRVATIPLASAIVSSGSGIAAGWGATDGFAEGQEQSAILQRVSLTVRSATSCNNAEVGSIRHLFSDEMCAGNSDGSVGTCHGDSGGPFIRARAGGGFELIGVASWGALYCTSYSVFSRVSSELNWIRTFVP